MANVIRAKLREELLPWDTCSGKEENIAAADAVQSAGGVRRGKRPLPERTAAAP
jgi:hypothetical protein